LARPQTLAAKAAGVYFCEDAEQASLLKQMSINKPCNDRRLLRWVWVSSIREEDSRAERRLAVLAKQNSWAITCFLEGL